jgi:ribosomal protein L11 methyltransferase
VPADEAEAVAAALIEAFPEGLEELVRGQLVELAVYADEEGEARLRSTFPEASSRPVAEGWEDRWKEFHRSTHAGGLWIGPPWIAPPDGDRVVVVDPGRAFGTGAHPTTRACIELLARLDRGSLLDLGCGSGVIAVAGAKLGFAPVRAVDLDEVAVAVAQETARRNGVAIEVCRADVLGDPLPATDVAVANIELGAVEELLGRVSARAVVTSGYLALERPRGTRWRHVDRIELEGWAADVWAGRH